MGGNKKLKASKMKHRNPLCVARNCTNSRKNLHGDVRFYYFPKPEESCRKWVRKCGRYDLMLKTSKYLSTNCVLCSDHFDGKQFVDRSKSRLVSDAVPTIFQHRSVVPQPTPIRSIRYLKRELLEHDDLTPVNRSRSTVAAATVLASMTHSVPAVTRAQSAYGAKIKTEVGDQLNGPVYYNPFSVENEYIELDVKLSNHILHLCKILPTGCSSNMQVKAQADNFLKFDIMKEEDSVKFSIKGRLKDLAEKVDDVWRCHLSSAKDIRVDPTQEMQDFLQEEINRTRKKVDNRVRNNDVASQKKQVTQKVNHAETSLSLQNALPANIVPKIEAVCPSADEKGASSETSPIVTTATEFVDNDTGSVSENDALDSVSDAGATAQVGADCLGPSGLPAMESQKNPLILSVERVSNQVLETVDVDLRENGYQGNLRIEPLHIQPRDDHNYHSKTNTPDAVPPVIQVYVKGDNPLLKVDKPAPAKTVPKRPEPIKPGMHRAIHPCPVSWCDRKFMAAGYIPKHMTADHSNMADFDDILAAWQATRKKTVAVKKTKLKKERFALAVACPVCKRRCPGTGIIRHFRVWHSTVANFDSTLRTLLDVLGRFKMKSLNYGKCPYCEQLMRVSTLRKHKIYRCKKNPDRKQVFYCDQCGFHATSIAALAAHKTSHVAMPYQCRKCNKTYTNKSSLKSHEIMKHEARQPVARCPYCPRKFGNVKSFQQHYASHTGEAKFACDHCDQTFHSYASRTSHKRSVHEKFTFYCQSCGKGFERSHQCHLLAGDKSNAKQSQQEAEISQ